MCGIAAIVASSPSFSLQETIDAMTESLNHRGPDDHGTVVLPQDNVALGMRRLSIVDLEGGHQPMWNEDRTVCVVFNGEIYNADELRVELLRRGHRFQTVNSDTEILVHGFEEWEADLPARLNGMFAFAVWDISRGEMFVARDRAGEKPLYFGRFGGGVAVASELKALLRCPGIAREIDLRAMEQFFSYDYVLGPRTMLKGTEKLGAGQRAIVTPHAVSPDDYWRPRFERGQLRGEALVRELDKHLGQAIARRMVADVPVGLFLSGGLDSTTVGYYMRRHSDEVNSFSIGFEDPQFDETSFASLAARALGTRHNLEIFSERQLRDLIPRIPEVLDEPMGDQSILPTLLLSLSTRQHVKVALGGDGSDELFMGYRAYKPLKLTWAIDQLPAITRRALARGARLAPTSLRGNRLRGVRLARTLDKSPPKRLISLLSSFGGEARWIFSSEVRDALTEWPIEPLESVIGNESTNRSSADQTVAAYLRGYLQEDILVKVDRASMAASLEVRSPFLDPAVIALALAAPPSERLRWFTGKYVLRRLMRGRIPDQIIDRPKVGFGVPLNAWLRGSLRSLMDDYLSPSRIRAEGLFDCEAVAGLVRGHRSGREDNGHQLWLLLQFEMWRDRWRL
jgi:asparagine synthase (glutamine-hydrolysing)